MLTETVTGCGSEARERHWSNRDTGESPKITDTGTISTLTGEDNISIAEDDVGCVTEGGFWSVTEDDVVTVIEDEVECVTEDDVECVTQNDVGFATELVS